MSDTLGFKTETETYDLVSVSMFKTKNQKSHCLRQQTKSLGLSLKNENRPSISNGLNKNVDECNFIFALWKC